MAEPVPQESGTFPSWLLLPLFRNDTPQPPVVGPSRGSKLFLDYVVNSCISVEAPEA